jgi:hypothetical protein
MNLSALLPNRYSSNKPSVAKAAILCLGMALLPSIVLAASPFLRCKVTQDGMTYTEDFLPTADPYSVQAKDINGQFQFKAVVFGTESLESIKIYTYYRQQHQVVLLHEARYLPPFNQSNQNSEQDSQNDENDPGNENTPNTASYAALTGINYLYSPEVEQELQYGCALLEASE